MTPAQDLPLMPLPEKQVEASDPYEFTAARYPVDDPLEADRDMARCFIEEYALMGFTPGHVLRLFREPIYTGTHDVYRRRGKDFVVELIEGVFGSAPPSTPTTHAEGE
jgi:hypothetical protein